MIALQPFTEADFPQLMTWLDSERLLRTWGGARFTFPLTPAQLTRYLAGANAGPQPSAFLFKAVDSGTGAAIGHIALEHLDWEARTGRIAQVLVGEVASRGQGRGQAVVQALLALAFAEIRLKRVGLGVYNFNAAALGCYRRCGFRHIGTLRHVARYEDEWWSSVELSLTAAEWQAARPAAGVAKPPVRRWRRAASRGSWQGPFQARNEAEF